MIVKSSTYQDAVGLLRSWSLCLLCSLAGIASAETINVAVASNFVTTLEQLTLEFEARTDHRVNLISGSSGKHYAQIINGAPFDLFLSADAERPRRLELDGRVSSADRSPYALGQLVLWHRSSEVPISARSLASGKAFQRLALANPRLAPYGTAALQTLERLGLRAEFEGKLVMGESVAQAFQFAYSGNAEWGFVALSQALAVPDPGAYWLVPPDFYHAISQEMVLLSDSRAARQLYDYLRSDAVDSILQTSGYLPPDTLR